MQWHATGGQLMCVSLSTPYHLIQYHMDTNLLQTLQQVSAQMLESEERRAPFQ